MTRKDFEKIAAVIRNLSSDVEFRRKVATDFSLMLGNENPRFDPERFYRACGV